MVNVDTDNINLECCWNILKAEFSRLERVKSYPWKKTPNYAQGTYARLQRLHLSGGGHVTVETHSYFLGDSNERNKCFIGLCLRFDGADNRKQIRDRIVELLVRKTREFGAEATIWTPSTLDIYVHIDPSFLSIAGVPKEIQHPRDGGIGAAGKSEGLNI